MLDLNKIYNCDCLEGLKQLDDNSIDMTVTSPPYDNLRSYLNKETGDECVWNFDVFKPIAQELYRVTKKGGVVVWVVGDACIDNGETGSSFRQALYFQELGFKLHDTMIYEKNSSSFPAKLTSKRYSQIFEYMFVFSKGKIRGDLKLIADKRNKWAGWTNWGEHSQYDAEGNLIKTQNIKPIAEFSLRTNIWRYPVSFNDKTGHPAVFPEKLAEDHILSWSNEGETVLDPFMGSGTTAKMAMMNHRNYIGFEVNSVYYKNSLFRIDKYKGKFNDKVQYVDVYELTNIDKKEIDTDTLQVNPVDDKDLDKKAELWKELTSELSDYFNTQSLGILKNLRVNLTFASKANDKRVKEVLESRGEQATQANSQCPTDINPILPIEDEAAGGYYPNDFEDVTDKDEFIKVFKSITPNGVDSKMPCPKETEATINVGKTPEFKTEPYGYEEFVQKTVIGMARNNHEFRQLIKDIAASNKKEYIPPMIVAKETMISEEEPSQETIPAKKKRGRPKGSKNKPKEKKETETNVEKE